jgi:hypothetical protein
MSDFKPDRIISCEIALHSGPKQTSQKGLQIHSPVKNIRPLSLNVDFVCGETMSVDNVQTICQKKDQCIR